MIPATLSSPLYAVVPAAGIGQRMESSLPKQYLTISGKTILELTLEALLPHPAIDQLVVALHPDDVWFEQLSLATHPKILRVVGGGERADSVLAALEALPEQGRVLVHDAARPCLALADLDALIEAYQPGRGAILASEVRDTMKRGDGNQCVVETVCRQQLWHALTPQLFDLQSLRQNLSQALNAGVAVTDEASAMEWAGEPVQLVPGRADNLKVTRPQDLDLAALYLGRQGRI